MQILDSPAHHEKDETKINKLTAVCRFIYIAVSIYFFIMSIGGVYKQVVLQDKVETIESMQLLGLIVGVIFYCSILYYIYRHGKLELTMSYVVSPYRRFGMLIVIAYLSFNCYNHLDSAILDITFQEYCIGLLVNGLLALVLG